MVCGYAVNLILEEKNSHSSKSYIIWKIGLTKYQKKFSEEYKFLNEYFIYVRYFFIEDNIFSLKRYHQQ